MSAPDLAGATIMRKQAKAPHKATVPSNSPSDGALTIAPLKKKPVPKAGRRPLQVVGWKPKGKWLVRLKRGSGTGPADRMTRGCDSLEDGRKTAEDYFKSGWDEAWVYEKQ